MGTDADIGTDDCVSANVSIRPDHCCGVDDGGWMNTRGIRRRLIEEAQRARKSVIRILDANRGCRDLLKLRLDNNRLGMSGASKRSVARICDKGNLGGSSFFDALDACDLEVGIAA